MELLRASSGQIRRLLIFRPGSLGDTVVALPSLRLIARTFPDAERWIITNRPVTPVSVPVTELLEGSGLVSGYFEADYVLVRSKFMAGWDLWRRIRHWRPDVLIYIPGRRSLTEVAREWTFFRSCGIRRIIGAPFKASLRENRWEPGVQRFEHEASRLARCLRVLGEPSLEDSASWSLALNETEIANASAALSSLGDRPVIICSVGTAVEVKDWGSANWCEVFLRIPSVAPGFGLALIGAGDEFVLSESVREKWRGPSINLCGRLKIREIAALMRHGQIYIGHDSGPMHLAAAAGISCVAVFASRELPGVWFPYGRGHKVIYHDVPCRKCQLDRCVKYAKRCIMSIEPEEVVRATAEVLARRHESAAPVRVSG
jgi:heptosyltransferase III